MNKIRKINNKRYKHINNRSKSINKKWVKMIIRYKIWMNRIKIIVSNIYEYDRKLNEYE